MALGLIARLLFPALTAGPALLAFGGIGRGLPSAPVIGGTVALSVVLQLVLERLLPYRARWNQGSLVRSDLVWLGLALVTSQVLDLGVFVALGQLAGALSAWWGATAWPSSWPLGVQAMLAIVIADFGHYWAHRALHEVPWLWAFHRVHHGPDHLYALNFFRMHPVDIVLKTFCNMAPLILLGAGPEVIAIWSVVSAVSAGSLNHANIALDTGWFDGWLSTPALHRWHHSRVPRETDTNYGNVTMIFDRLFGTYLRPREREVAEVGVIGVPDSVREAIWPFPEAAPELKPDAVRAHSRGGRGRTDAP
jgi:sterol desaturase/sphingolipid hydroxylase (fatty acid hydroxylase superfamily)